MRKIIVKGNWFISLLSICILMGCSQDEKIGLDPVDSVAPAAPTDIEIENTNGGAIISFKAPKDDDLLCVVASYMINGVERTTKASPYVNKLKVEGFGKTGDYQISLKSVDKSKNESQPLLITIHPSTPPVELIFKSLSVFDSFGGVKLSWENATEANIIVEVFKKEDDDWTSAENFYSSAKDGKATMRGYEPKPINFRLRIRDRWDNYSEFLETNSLPLEESELDKSKFRTVTPLPGDVPTYDGSYGVEKIWDKETVNNSFHSSNDINGIGRAITFDLGVEAKLSRFKMWQRSGDQGWLYNHNNLKHYVIYGCNEITTEMRESGILDDDGNYLPTFEGWTKIHDAYCFKPSGDSGNVTNEDKEYILGGDEQEVSIDAPSFRYVRVYMLENWSGGVHTQIAEMSFWGQLVKTN